jgi:hypothetical protein
MNEDETILHAPCGHGCCRMCWEGLVLVALQDSSTTKVKTGATDLLDVSKLMCPGCTCVLPILFQFVVLSRDFSCRYTPSHMDPFLSLSFVQAVVPSTATQIAQSLCKVATTHLIICVSALVASRARTMRICLSIERFNFFS